MHGIIHQERERESQRQTQRTEIRSTHSKCTNHEHGMSDDAISSRLRHLLKSTHNYGGSSGTAVHTHLNWHTAASRQSLRRKPGVCRTMTLQYDWTVSYAMTPL